MSAAADGALSVTESSERIDVAPPAFLRTLRHGTGVMLTGNHPPALIATHAYYEQRRWRRLVGDDLVARHTAMHDGTAATTARTWDDRDWPDQLPDTPPASIPAASPERGSVGDALHAEYPTVPCDLAARAGLGPAGAAIPDQLSARPGRWRNLDLPPELAARVGLARVDLADPAVRSNVLPIWLETGPADQLSADVTHPQLRDVWNDLPLSDLLRHAWEACFPRLRNGFPDPDASSSSSRAPATDPLP